MVGLNPWEQQHTSTTGQDIRSGTILSGNHAVGPTTVEPRPLPLQQQQQQMAMAQQMMMAPAADPQKLANAAATAQEMQQPTEQPPQPNS